MRSILALLLMLSGAASATAATIEVTTTVDQNSDTADDGSCSLREAVIAANTNAALGGCPAGEADPTVDEITVPAGTYFLTIPSVSFESFAETGDLDIREAVEIRGESVEETILDLGELPVNGSFFGDSGGFDSQLSSFELSHFTIRNAYGSSPVTTTRDTSIHRVWIHSSFASEGGAIRVGDGVLRLRDSTLSGNEGWHGGAVIVRENATAEITNTTIMGNRACFGGGLFAVFSGEIELLQSTVAGNTVGQLSSVSQMCNGISGSAINRGAGTVTITNSIVEGDCSDFPGQGGTFMSGGGNIESPGDTCGLGMEDLAEATAEQLDLEERDDPVPPILRPRSGSIAIDFGVDVMEPLTDQRGFARPVDGNGDEIVAFDAGAIEVQPFVIDPYEPPLVLELCDTLFVTGEDIRPDSLVKIFISTANGAVDVLPDGLVPGLVTPTGLVVNLPCPWPTEGYLLGQGFAAVQLVSPAEGYAATPPVGIPIIGCAISDTPGLLTVDGDFLADSSWDESIAVANIERVIIPGSSVDLGGENFQDPVVNLFSASGNCGPLEPTSVSSFEITVDIPPSCPTGPGSFQVVNRTTFRASNAVAVVIGAQPSISSIQVNGGVVTVEGAGFSELIAPAFFAFSQATGELTNYGGFDSNGDPLLPVTFVDSTEVRMNVPADAVAGAAYLQLLNPPFIPFSSTGNGPSGSFVLP